MSVKRNDNVAELREATWGVEPDAPPTLEELWHKARVDLEDPRGGARLKWCFMHSRAIGRLVEAQQRVEHYEALERDLRSRQMAIYPPNADQLAAMKSYARPFELDEARLELREANACAMACEHVMRLLERRPAPTAVSTPTTNFSPTTPATKGTRP